MAKYFYKNIVIVPYSNGYRSYYKHSDGTKELLHVVMHSKANAMEMAKKIVDYMNGKGI